MQGLCLYPLTLEKQTAMRTVLEDLLMNAGYARKLFIKHVSGPYLKETNFLGTCPFTVDCQLSHLDADVLGIVSIVSPTLRILLILL